MLSRHGFHHAGPEGRRHGAVGRRLTQAAVGVTCGLCIGPDGDQVRVVEQLHRLDLRVAVLQHGLLGLWRLSNDPLNTW